MLCTVHLCRSQTDTTFTPQPLDPRFLAALADTCYSPVLTVNVTVAYQGYAKAYLEIEGMKAGVAITLKNTAEGSLLSLTSDNNGAVTISNLPLEKTYEVGVLNHCGKLVTIGYVDTKTGKKDAIDVSTRLYEALTDFQHQQAEIPLTQYLAELQGVAFYEKVAFLQQYYYNGQPLSVDSDSELPPPGHPEGDSCNCRFVFNTVQTAVPVKLMSNGTIQPEVITSEKRPLCTDYSAYWWVRQSAGAAKWHHLWTEGSKAGSSICTWRMSMLDSTDASPFYGQLRYNLLCTNYAEIPKACGCEKPLYLYYKYDSDVEAFAQRHPEGIGEKKAYAAAEDIGMALLHWDGSSNVKVLRTKGAKAQANCEQSVNPAFWTQILKIAGATAGFFLDSTNSQYSSLVTKLINQITPIFSIPYYDVKECTSARATGTLFRGDTLIYLKPNQPVDLFLYSLTNLEAGGKRSWFSNARANSDFYLVGYVPGGLLAEHNPTCCTRKIANWVFASDGPTSLDNLKNQVGAILGAWNPWPYPSDPNSGITAIPSQYGWMSQISSEDCEGTAINGTLGGHRSTEDWSTWTAGQPEGEINVFDVSGHLLYHSSFLAPVKDLRDFLREKNVVQAAGLYFVQTIVAGQKELRKVFME